MNQVRKLKRDNKLYIGVFYTLNGVLVIVFASMNLLKPYLFVFFGLLLGVVGINILFSLRTKNPWYLVTSFHYLTLAIAIWAEFNSHDKLKKYMLLFFLFTLVCLLTVGIMRKVKWRREEILELAAGPVQEVENGFTERPFPSGKADYTPEEVKTFAGFSLKNLIAVPYYEQNRIVLAITGHYIDHMLNIRNDYSKDSWVAFDFNGNVSVFIIKDDYLQYKDELSFNQLCKSLGDLFKEFLHNFKNGEEVKIINRLSEIKLSPFTGGLVGF